MWLFLALCHSLFVEIQKFRESQREPERFRESEVRDSQREVERGPKGASRESKRESLWLSLALFHSLFVEIM